MCAFAHTRAYPKVYMYVYIHVSPFTLHRSSWQLLTKVIYACRVAAAIKCKAHKTLNNNNNKYNWTAVHHGVAQKQRKALCHCSRVCPLEHRTPPVEGHASSIARFSIIYSCALCSEHGNVVGVATRVHRRDRVAMFVALEYSQLAPATTHSADK